jgi:hypothetical protein
LDFVTLMCSQKSHWCFVFDAFGNHLSLRLFATKRTIRTCKCDVQSQSYAFGFHRELLQVSFPSRSRFGEKNPSRTTARNNAVQRGVRNGRYCDNIFNTKEPIPFSPGLNVRLAFCDGIDDGLGSTQNVLSQFERTPAGKATIVTCGQSVNPRYLVLLLFPGSHNS